MFSGRFRFYAYLRAPYAPSLRVSALSDRPSRNSTPGHRRGQSYGGNPINKSVWETQRENLFVGSTQKPRIKLSAALWRECHLLLFLIWRGFLQFRDTNVIRVFLQKPRKWGFGLLLLSWQNAHSCMPPSQTTWLHVLSVALVIYVSSGKFSLTSLKLNYLILK